ncbi:MAG: radical SAM protein [Oscillospiraceae bacterium]|nr:radical SAM protein [Oscillospiraceae bacterium]
MHYTQTKGILSAKNGMNIYRGCSHGCIYCDSRSACYGFTHDFEDIEVKQNAPELLERALKSKRKRCVIGTGSMCDPYMHIEKTLCLSRQCLEIIDRHGFGVSLLTKSDLVLRDIDLLKSINAKAKAVVQMTITTADDELCRKLEPNVCPSSRRFEVLCEMRDNGIPTVLWLCPLLPFINDTEENLRGVLDYAKRAGCYGVMSFGMGLTLREGDREYFYAALDRLFPGLRQRYERTFGLSYEIASPNAKRLWEIFRSECEKNGIEWRTENLFGYLSQIDEEEQLTLF